MVTTDGNIAKWP